MHTISSKWLLSIQLVLCLQLGIILPFTSTEFCDSQRNIQRIACAPGEGCVYGVRTSSSWVQGQMVCDCHGMQFADIPPGIQLSIDSAPKNLKENLWISGSKTDILPCGFVKGLTKAVDIVCTSFETGVFLWIVQAFYTQKHRGDPAIPICRKEGCTPEDVRFCIHFGNETTDWYDARNQCLEQGGDLFYLTQEDNDNFLQFMMTFINIIVTIQQIGSPVYWSGIRYEDWYWQATGDVKMSNWAPNEPHYDDDYDCMAMNMTTGKWVSMPCKYNFSVMCRDPSASFIPNPSTSSTLSTTRTTTTQINITTTASTTKTSAETATTKWTTAESTTSASMTLGVTDAQTEAEQSTTEKAEGTTIGAENITTESPNASGHVTLPYCSQNSAVCSAVPAVVVILAVALLIIGLIVCWSKGRRSQEKTSPPSYPIQLPHTVEDDFSGLNDGARAAENIYVDPLKGGLKDEEGIYDEIGKKPGFEDDDDDYYDDVGTIKKPPLDDDFDSLKKPSINYAFEFEDDLKKH